MDDVFYSPVPMTEPNQQSEGNQILLKLFTYS